MGFSIKYIYQAIDKFTPTLKKIESSVASLDGKLEAAGAAVHKFGDRVEKMGMALRTAGRQITFGLSLPLAAIGIAAMKSAAQLDELQMRMTMLTGSANIGRSLTRQLEGFSVNTPFNLEDSEMMANRLLALGVHPQAIMKKMTFLGNVAAGSQMPIATLMNYYGRVASTHEATSAILTRLNAKGIPILSVLGKMYHKTSLQVEQMGKKHLISAFDFERALMIMSGVGGKFANAMKNYMQTLPGAWKHLIDSIHLDLGFLGQDFEYIFKVPQRLNQMADSINRLTQRFLMLPTATRKWIFELVTFLAILGPTLVFLGYFVLALRQLSFIFTIVGGAIEVCWAILAGGLSIFGLLTFLIIGGAVAIGYLVVKFGLLTKIGHAFGAMFRMVGGWAHDLVGYIDDMIDAVSRLWHAVNHTSFGGSTGSWGSSSNLTSTTNRSHAMVTVNIQDPGKQVTGVQAKTKGPIKTNVGLNMAPAGVSGGW